VTSLPIRAEVGAIAAARLLLVAPVIAGAGQALTAPGPLPEAARRAGLPYAETLTQLTAGAMLVGAAALGTGLAPVIGGAVITVSLVGTTAVVHNFWRMQDQDTKLAHRRAFLANCGLLGGVLVATVHAYGTSRPRPKLGNYRRR
jgi:uncharacterized membrane protein YphA (DoxX/SURF4 family)